MIKNILVANNHLNFVGGSETFTYTVIENLIKKGYNVQYFTFVKGDFSARMEKELNVSFMSKSSYDLILANHHTCVKALYKKGYTIQTCHGVFPDLEQPSVFANYHVSISKEVQNHLLLKGFSSCLIMNGIDLNKFNIKNPINVNLTSVLSLCQSESANEVIKEACDSMGILFSSLNKLENPIWDVADEINKSDLIVGLGRSAYEAMACGRPVVIYDNRPYSESFADGYISDVLPTSLLNNCSGRFYKKKFTSIDLIEEFKKYNFNDGPKLRKFTEDLLDIESVCDEYINLALTLKRNLTHNKRVLFFQFFRENINARFARKLFKIFYSKFYKRELK